MAQITYEMIEIHLEVEENMTPAPGVYAGWREMYSTVD
jgi:hypothetical protein